VFNVLKLNTDVVAVCQSSESGSDVLIFRRNEGLLGRVSVQERGDALEHRLERSFAQIAEKSCIAAQCDWCKH